MLQDLHSRNGTFVNRICLKPGAAVKLNAGDQLSFGSQEHVFSFDDAGPPKMLAMHGPSRTVRVAESGLLALPSSERPEVTLFLNSEGMLMIERADGVSQLGPQQSIVVNDEPWMLFPPPLGLSTSIGADSLVFEQTSFHFEVSPSEAVNLTLVQQATQYKLESREHTYLLLTLARARYAQRELALSERGWLSREALLRMLKLDLNALDVSIHRARKQLAEQGMANAAAVVQVKRGFKRFGTERFIIEPA